MRYRFNRSEVAGAMGDLGTLLPLAMAMVLINGIDPKGTLWAIGLFYVAAGLYYGVTVPVQPMKVIGAYAIATGMDAGQITAAGLQMGVCLLLVGLSGAGELLRRLVPKPAIRGVQLATGVLLMREGIRFMAGSSRFQALQQAAEPYLRIQSLGPLPLGWVIGLAAAAAILLLLENRRIPAGLAVVAGGVALGLVLGRPGNMADLAPGWHLPAWLPLGVPPVRAWELAFLGLVLPQLPMTMGNAVLANVDLAESYFGPQARRTTPRALCVSMGLANLFSFCVGGMPLCHGAGGLAAHYRFGARTAGSNLVIGGLFILLVLLLGDRAMALLTLLPMAVLGALLLFAGAQLGLTVIDLNDRKSLFVPLLMLGITLAANLAVAFAAGIAVSYALRSERLSI